MTLPKPTFGHNVDMHAEQVLNRARETHKREQAFTPWHTHQQIQITPGTIITTSSRAEHPRVLHPEITRQPTDLIPV